MKSFKFIKFNWKLLLSSTKSYYDVEKTFLWFSYVTLQQKKILVDFPGNDFVNSHDETLNILNNIEECWVGD